MAKADENASAVKRTRRIKAAAERPQKQRRIISENVDVNCPASIVINKLGGLTRVCEKTGWNPSTVHGWTLRSRGLIPANKQPILLALGKDLPDPVTHADFFRKDQA